MTQHNRSPLGLYMIGIAALFLAGSLLLVILGAHTYRNAAKGQEDNNHTRALLSYVQAAVRAGDSAGGIRIENDASKGQVLVIADGDRYAQRIYLSDGKLVEDYNRLDAPLDPKNAIAIGDSRVFELELDQERGMLRVETEEGPAVLHIRSQGVKDHE